MSSIFASMSRIPPTRNRTAVAGGGDPRPLLRQWSRAEHAEARIAELEKGEKRDRLSRYVAHARACLWDGNAGPAKYWLDLIDKGLRAPAEIAEAIAESR